MGDDTRDRVDVDDPDGPRARYDGDDESFRPLFGVPDRFERRVRTDHAANQVLHDALKLSYPPGTDEVIFNLMASHAPGEKEREPTYEVWVKSFNHGGGHPVIPGAVRRLVDQGRAVITHVVECSDDELTVSIRPVERSVEPIDVPYRALPDDVVRTRDVGRELGRLYHKFVALSEADDAWDVPAKDAWEAAATKVRKLAIEYDVPVEWDGAAHDERVEEAAEWLDDPEAGESRDVDLDDLRAVAPPGFRYPNTPPVHPFEELGRVAGRRPPIEPIREWVVEQLTDDLALIDEGGVEKVAEMIQEAIYNHTIFGDPRGVDADPIVYEDAGGVPAFVDVDEMPPADLLGIVERLAHDDDSTLTFGDVLAVVSNNRSPEWIYNNVLFGEHDPDRLVIDVEDVVDDLRRARDDLRKWQEKTDNGAMESAYKSGADHFDELIAEYEGRPGDNDPPDGADE